MKNCSKCLILKDYTNFYTHKVHGYRSECKTCTKLQNDKWKASNKQRRSEVNKIYRLNNKEAVKLYNKNWAKQNKGKVTAYARAYQLAKLKAMPKWLSADQKLAIEQFYINRPEGYHVDHIIPLNGDNVSGLHVLWNLQYLKASENIKKGNRI